VRCHRVRSGGTVLANCQWLLLRFWEAEWDAKNVLSVAGSKQATIDVRLFAPRDSMSCRRFVRNGAGTDSPSNERNSDVVSLDVSSDEVERITVITGYHWLHEGTSYTTKHRDILLSAGKEMELLECYM
jgi:hypothetical protein